MRFQPRRMTFLLPAFLLCAQAALPARVEAQFGRNKVQFDDFDFRVMESDHFDWHFYEREAEAVADVAPPESAAAPAEAEPAIEAATSTELPAREVVELAELASDDALRAARDELVDELVGNVVRGAKRLLQDEQNDLLDAVRRTRGRTRVDAQRLLPEPEVSRDAWAA